MLNFNYSASTDDDTLGRVSDLYDGNATGTLLVQYTYLGQGTPVRVDFNKIWRQRPDAPLQSGCSAREAIRTTVWISSAAWSISGWDEFRRLRDPGRNRARLRPSKQPCLSRGFRLVEEPNPSTPVYLDELYAYDGVDRLTNRQRGELAEDSNNQKIIQNKNFAEEWTLDALGNWTNFKQDTNGDNIWEFDQGRTHTVANEIDHYRASSMNVLHDAAGNMIKRPSRAIGRATTTSPGTPGTGW